MKHPWRDPKVELPTKKSRVICYSETFHGFKHIATYLCFENGRFFDLDKNKVIAWCYEDELIKNIGLENEI